MRRSDALIKIMALVIFLALAIYIGISAYNAKNNTLKTVIVDRFELTDSAEVEGYAVRYEKALSNSGKNISVKANEGDRVSPGAAVAVSYNSAAALKRADEIRELKLKIERLSAESIGRNVEDIARQTIFELSEAVANKDLSEIDALTFRAETYILGVGADDTEDAEEAIGELEDRIAYLEDASSSDTEEIFVPEPGIFSHYLDGFEDVTPEELYDLTPSSLKSLFSSGSRVSGNDFGKLVLGTVWKYAAVMDSDHAKILEVGRTEELRFKDTYNGTIRMTVESIGAAENGRCAVVFSCDRNLKDIAPLRELSAELVLSHKEGLRVPREALHLDEDGNTFVYVLQGLQAQKISIEILGEDGDYYMVAESSDGLHKGAEVIAAGNGIHDGKVVI